MPFLDRLKAGAKKREGALEELRKRYYSPEVIAGKPDLLEQRRRADLALVSDVVARECQVQLSDDANERDEQLEEAIQVQP